MKARLVFGVLLMCARGCIHSQLAERSSATIEFVRQEDNGFINIVPCTLVLSDNQRIILSGGERAIVSVAPGNFSVTASSIDPYPYSHPPGFGPSSALLRFYVAPDQSLRIFVDPASSGSEYTSGWTIAMNSPKAP